MRNILIVFLLGLVLMVGGCGSSPTLPEPVATPTEPAANPLEPVEDFYSQPAYPSVPLNVNPVTGLISQRETNKALAVMVENTPQARPQSGLDKAEVVYEMFAEGGITRFMAIYHENQAKVVGPVRSARPYFVTIAREWNAGYAHAGGSTEALALLRKWGMQDLDEIYRFSQPYWRDSSRKAPHNLYTDTQKLEQYFNKPGRLRSWPFEEILTSGGLGQTVVIPYNSFTNTTYKYNPGSGVYLRFIGQNPHVDRETGKQLEAANVIVQYAVHRSSTSPGAVDIGLVGKGKAEYFREGHRFSGYWEKKGLDEQTQFFLEDGSLFQLRPGTTWIQVVPPHIKAVVKP